MGEGVWHPRGLLALGLRSLATVMASCSRFQGIPDLPPAPHQRSTSFVYPKCAFGKKNIVWRSFQQAMDLVALWWSEWLGILSHLCLSTEAEEDERIQCWTILCFIGLFKLERCNCCLQEAPAKRLPSQSCWYYDNYSSHYKTCWRVTVTHTLPGEGH